ncbi:hypothetical protein BDV59DRAFT_211274 [Aspergillus ambiguus]|uniref:putative NF-X1 finger and helicase domain protein n=1 Tax=Aspergillus ambiguus TaxID=176160 RepID=UPI003CCD01AF
MVVLLSSYTCILQGVVQSLASEGGLSRIQELVEQGSSTMASAMKRDRFHTQILPFLEIVSHPDALSSLILEQSVGTIYNVLYGRGGSRAVCLFKYIGDVLESCKDDRDYGEKPESSCNVFPLEVELNSEAQVQKAGNTTLHRCHRHLSRLLRRHEIGSSLPTDQKSVGASNKANPSFVITDEPLGGRHNNDHTNICDIRIMPTYEEITCERTEYLPTTDLTQWHRDGVEGLLDRNFRLLREDTIGQLRDAFHFELQPSSTQRAARQRTLTYRDVRIMRLDLDSRLGFYFEVQFSQPLRLKLLTTRERQIWWQMSKRLQPGALVCLVVRDKSVIFCTVTELRPTKKPKINEPSGTAAPSLWTRGESASVLLHLVASPMSLVEFPGVLLAAFEPTLRTLQSISESENLPFPDLLLPSDLPIDGRRLVPPPSYTLDPGFTFNLRCLMVNGKDFYIRTGQPVDIKYLQENSGLDSAQAKAAVHSLQHKIGIIQGPPGTGKSYTGVALIKVLLAIRVQGNAKLGPVICVTYTNHALDQLLEALIEKEITSQIIRIGSRSKSQRLHPFNLRVVSQNVISTKAERSAHWGLRQKVEAYRNEFVALGFGGDITATHEDGFQIITNRDPQVAIDRWLHDDSYDRQVVRSVDDLETTSASHSEAKSELGSIRHEVNLRCLSKAHIIGLTSSGLARNLNMLRKLQSKVVLYEEAAEVLEAHLLTALLPSVEHTILIGDHQQLRPQVQNYDLSRENPRAISSNLPFSSLETQRRMHPSIAELDAPSVSEYPEVAGMRKRLFWLDHQFQEGGASIEDAMSTSHWNQHELDMTVGLVRHIIRQGKYHGTEVAVFTPYLGQPHRLRQILGQSFAIALSERDQEDLDKARFEHEAAGEPTGEEAKVVIISLVRSNPQNRCGFLRTPNRINVLLSLLDILRRDENIGPTLELQCPRHPDTPIYVSEPEVFTRVSPEGGCNLRCVHRLSCGHACVQKCHSSILHNTVYCLEPCQCPVKRCTHECPKKCGDPCPSRCTVTVFQADRTPQCGHVIQNLPCCQSQDLKAVLCTVMVQKEVPNCYHTASVACHIDVTSMTFQRCNVCARKTPGGISKVKHGPCNQRCGRKHSSCAHVCMKPCHGNESCPPCSEPCDIHCDHSKCMRKCSEPCPPCAAETCLSRFPHSSCGMPCAAPCDNVPCSRRCNNILDCGHQCPSVCGERCPPTTYCQECADDNIQNQQVDFILGQTYREINLNETPCIFPSCGHFLTMESMDAQMDMTRFYVVDNNIKPIAIKGASEPFSIDDIKSCARCRGSLRDIARYRRLVRRALLDDSTKKLILYLNNEYVPLAQEVSKKIKLLNDAAQCRAMAEIIQSLLPGRWKAVMETRWRVNRYCQQVAPIEQPFNRVRNMVESARRSNNTISSFDFDNNILQTRGMLQGMALSILLDIALLADSLQLEQLSWETNPSSVTLQLDEIKQDCPTLIQTARDTNRLLQKTEGHIFLAKLLALEHCGLLEEVDGVEKRLEGCTFYTAVTNEERMSTNQAMAREFRGTGHWYYCRNEHPFTIGECGGPMERTTCFECGKPVGGQHHQAAQGVTMAMDLEREFEQMLL